MAIETSMVVWQAVSAAAAEGAKTAGEAGQQMSGASSSAGFVWYFVAAALAAGFGMAWAAFGVVKGQSAALTKAMEGVARQPESAKPMFVPLLLGLAFMELLGLLAFVVMMVITFPLTKTVVDLIGAMGKAAH